MDIIEYNPENSPAPTKMRRLGLVSEWKSIFQIGRLGWNYHSLTKIKPGNGERVILLPGFMSSEITMFPLKHYLDKIGYNPEYWGLGTNTGDVESLRDRMIAKLENESSTEKVSLVGWSLGGVVAREIARLLPDRIKSVFLFGSPIKGPAYTAGVDFYDQDEVDRITKLTIELDATNPVQVPMSIAFSKNDNIVSWPSCLDKSSPEVTHYEVNSTHLSMGIDPAIWKLISTHLSKYK